MRVKEVEELVFSVFPAHHTLEWDNCGLQVGDPEDKVERVLISLDVSHDTLSEAKALGCNLIVSHHPLLFRATKRIDASNPTGGLILKCARLGVSVLSFHTNVDAAPGGLADELCRILKVENPRPLTPEGIGRIGNVPPTEPEELVELVLERLGLDGAQTVKGAEGPVERVAVCPGSGGDLMEVAISAEAQFYITGDVKYHQAQEAAGRLWVLDAQHFHTELPFCRLMKRVLEEAGITCFTSKAQTSPFTYTPRRR